MTPEHVFPYLAPALRDAAEDVHHLLEDLPLAGELAVHVVVQENLYERVGGLEPPEKLVQHRDAPQRRHLENRLGGGFRGVIEGRGAGGDTLRPYSC